MKLTVVHQESYSRTELFLRTLFGAFYIVLSHAFILFFLTIWGGILAFVAFWVVLLSGRYPGCFFH